MTKPEDEIARYIAWNEQEERDRRLILEFITNHEDAFVRNNELAHMTASSWIVNPNRDKVLMVYHNIYRSWSWTGGHADGERDLRAVAIREACEETGLSHVKLVSPDIYSLEVLTVEGHIRKGIYVSSHLHLNVTYLLEANENEKLSICEAENSAVRWFSFEEACEASTEPWFVENIYKKLNAKLEKIEK